MSNRTRFIKIVRNIILSPPQGVVSYPIEHIVIRYITRTEIYKSYCCWFGSLPHAITDNSTVCAYHDVIIRAMAFKITGASIVCWAVCSGTYQMKHQWSTSLDVWRESAGWLPSQRASSAENVSISWGYHVLRPMQSNIRDKNLSSTSLPSHRFPSQGASSTENLSTWSRVTWIYRDIIHLCETSMVCMCMCNVRRVYVYIFDYVCIGEMFPSFILRFVCTFQVMLMQMAIALFIFDIRVKVIPVGKYIGRFLNEI